MERSISIKELIAAIKKLPEDAGLDAEIVQAVRSAADAVSHHSAKVAAIRRCAPWALVYQALFDETKTTQSSVWSRLRGRS